MKTHAILPAVIAFLSAAGIQRMPAREWTFTGIPTPVEAEFVAMKNGGVVLRGPNGKSFEIPFANFGAVDQKYLRAVEANGGQPPPPEPGKPVTARTGYKSRSVTTLENQTVALDGPMELHLTGAGDPAVGSTFNFTSPDAWLFFENVVPSVVKSRFLSRMRVDGSKASTETNVRVVRYGSGAVVIPQPPDFPALTVYDGTNLTGQSKPLKCFTRYDDARLGALKKSISSFVLKRGYTATIAREEDGSGVSRNYVAQDHDLVIDSLPAELDKNIRFIRIYPWRWTGKKGIAGGIGQKLEAAWFYDWNIGTDSSPDVEYVPIAQKLGWPNLDQNWEKRGSVHLLGFNEPDHKDQSNLTVDQAIKAWPALLVSGLRVGSPAVSDGGLGWLYDFMGKAKAANLRVDFVAVHYYRAVGDPGDAKGAADQMFRFLKDIHDRTKLPIWVTEWNNGANWTTAPDPNDRQQKAAIAAMIKMMDETPFVERYAAYNWVEACRELSRKDGSLTPAGEVYRDQKSPVSYIQEKVGK
ncbi:hypothetical protein JIN84_10065 [Luteolibacter yonseiensis]|uniref:Asl1-like glycosyl hydrolase catalytic domain-containing protein n=1 Tax=Luteolibacter yonseiensis TaxID=1144680 RepID=A0A934R660_9BACT|nr:glycosyl hydrolase [Luteolibacter yonseiensis]MBK1815965.1 hypothetical protein [Luteolibacter yonseiensis]